MDGSSTPEGADAPKITPPEVSSPESLKPEGPKAFFATYEVRRNEDLSMLQSAAEKTGVKVNVLAREGEQYTTLPSLTIINGHEMRNMRQEPFTGTVGEGQSYLMISGTTLQERGLGDFWDEVDRLKTERESNQAE